MERVGLGMGEKEAGSCYLVTGRCGELVLALSGLVSLKADLFPQWQYLWVLPLAWGFATFDSLITLVT